MLYQLERPRHRHLLTLLVLGALVLVACSDGGSERNRPDVDDNLDRSQSQQWTGTPPEEAILIPATVSGWPTIEVSDCSAYKPTNDREIVRVVQLTAECIEAAFRSSSVVFFSSRERIPMSDDLRAQHEKWGEVDGHEVLVKVRGDELISGYRTQEARVPDTGEVAILAIGSPPEETLADRDDFWPYRPSE